MHYANFAVTSFGIDHEGKILFYPWGKWAGGYQIDTVEQAVILSRQLEWIYKVSAGIFLLLLPLSSSDLLTAAFILAAMLVYYFDVKWNTKQLVKTAKFSALKKSGAKINQTTTSDFRLLLTKSSSLTLLVATIVYWLAIGGWTISTCWKYGFYMFAGPMLVITVYEVWKNAGTVIIRLKN